MDPLATRYDLRITGILGALLMGVLAAFALANPATFKGQPDQPLLDGNWANAYGKGFDETLAVRKPATDLFGALNYALFRDGRRGVLIGSDDWLFSSEEMTAANDVAPIVANKLAFVKSVERELRARNVRLAVALIPAKLRIYAEYGGSYRLLPQLDPVYDNALAELRSAGIAVPDLRPPLFAAKRSEPVFLRTDTHWTPFGAQAVARALAQAINQAGIDWPADEYRYVPGPALRHDGDLMNFIPLGRWRSIGPAPDQVRTGEVVAAGQGASGGLLGKIKVPVALVGTSYSFNQKWGFEGALKLALHSDLVNAAREGEGPFRPMQRYLANPETRADPPRVVIWELPERYLWTTSTETGLPE